MVQMAGDSSAEFVCIPQVHLWGDYGHMPFYIGGGLFHEGILATFIFAAFSVNAVSMQVIS